MRPFVLLLILFASHCCLSALDLSPYELKSVNGHKVDVVAVYKVGPKGLTFSPKPKNPLIGSNQMEKLSTDWINIDISSLNKYPELKKAYQSAIKGKEIELNIGPYFYDLSECHKEIMKEIPMIYYWSAGLRRSMRLDLLVMDDGKLRPKRWSMRPSSAKKTQLLWKETYNSLEAIDYRTDVMDYRNTLSRALKGIESITNGETAFDITAARRIDDLYRTEF